MSIWSGQATTTSSSSSCWTAENNILCWENERFCGRELQQQQQRQLIQWEPSFPGDHLSSHRQPEEQKVNIVIINSLQMITFRQVELISIAVVVVVVESAILTVLCANITAASRWTKRRRIVVLNCMQNVHCKPEWAAEFRLQQFDGFLRPLH